MFDKSSLKKIKLVVFDLDGTLLDNEGVISSRTVSLIKKLESKGILFTIASGRIHSALADYAKSLNINIPIISLDGCCISNPVTDEIIFESFIPVRYVDKALDYADKFLLNVALCRTEAIYFTESNSVMKDMINKFGAKFEEIEDYNSIKDKTLEIVFASDYRDNIKYVYDRLRFPYTIGLNVSYYKSHKQEGIYYLEVRKRGANKGKALRKLLNNISIKKKDVAVIGDWFNDISLFENGALKVTLENGIYELKSMADIVINKSNNEEGVAEFLDMLLKVK
jgi:Cof subfamily protein (haloacid dehalogenase superfamily)